MFSGPPDLLESIESHISSLPVVMDQGIHEYVECDCVLEAIVSVHRVWQEELKLQKNLMLQTITDQRPYSPKSSIVVAMPSSSNVNSGNKADADFMDGKSRVKSPILGNTDDKPTSGAVIGTKVLLDDFILCDKNARVSKDESVIRNNTTGGTLLNIILQKSYEIANYGVGYIIRQIIT